MNGWTPNLKTGQPDNLNLVPVRQGVQWEPFPKAWIRFRKNWPKQNRPAAYYREVGVVPSWRLDWLQGRIQFLKQRRGFPIDRRK
jgi:hypothetical protein